MTSEDPIWRLSAASTDPLEWGGDRLKTHRASVVGLGPKLDVYRLYWINGAITANDYVAKALLAWSKLRGQGDDSALIIVYAPQSALGDDTGAAISDFTSAMARPIEHALEAARGSAR